VADPGKAGKQAAADSSAASDGGLIGKFLSGDQALTTPDVTKVQALAIGQAAIAVLVVLGFNLDDDVKNAIITLSIALAAALPVSDAVVRQARAKNARGIAEARLLSKRQSKRGRISLGADPPPAALSRQQLRERLATMQPDNHKRG
jgi:hypothetical protein